MIKIIEVLYAILFIGCLLASVVSAAIDVMSPMTGYLYTAACILAIAGIGAIGIGAIFD